MLFFLVSCFFITYSHTLKRDKSFGRFLVRPKHSDSRAAGCGSLRFLWGRKLLAGRYPPVEWGSLALNLAMMQDSAPLKPSVIVAPYMDNSPLWSLSYEWWFYLPLFGLFTFMRSWNSRTIIVLGFAVAAAAAYGPWSVAELGSQDFVLFSVWWIGALFAVDYLGYRTVRPLLALTRAAIILIVAIPIGTTLLRDGIAGINGFGIHPMLESRHVGMALVLGFMALSWQATGWVGYSWILRPFAIVAPMSYALYVLHKPLLGLIDPLAAMIGLAAARGAVLSGIFVLSALTEL